jgi:hypothetical protein
MKKLSIGDMMSYWGFSIKKGTIGFATHKYEAKKGDWVTGGRTALEAAHTMVSFLKARKA